MNDKRKEATIWLLTILIIILIGIIIGLFIYKVKANREEREYQIAQLKDKLVQTNEIQSKEAIESTQKAIVTTAISKIIIDDETNEEIDTNKIPQINLDFENTKKINKDIYDYYADNSNILVEYNYYLNGNVLSLVLSINDKYIDYPSYEVYNIDITTGEDVSNDELLKTKGISTQKCEEAIKTEFEKLVTVSNIDEMSDDVKIIADEIKSKTLSEDNCDYTNISMFLNDKNELNVIGYIYSIAGAEAYYKLINLNI